MSIDGYMKRLRDFLKKKLAKFANKSSMGDF